MPKFNGCMERIPPANSRWWPDAHSGRTQCPGWKPVSRMHQLSMLFGPIRCSDSRERSSVAKVGIAVLMLEPAVGCCDYWTMTIHSPSNSICIPSSSSFLSMTLDLFCRMLFCFFGGQEWLIALNRTLAER